MVDSRLRSRQRRAAYVGALPTAWVDLPSCRRSGIGPCLSTVRAGRSTGVRPPTSGSKQKGCKGTAKRRYVSLAFLQEPPCQECDGNSQEYVLSSVDPLSLLSQSSPPLRVTADEGRHAPIEPGYLSAMLIRHGSMELRWYAPQGSDPQQPHDRDELYIIVSGHGVFIRAEEKLPFGEDRTIVLGGAQRVSVQPGDALFVPAGTEHRFESISTDFGAWIIFYGPEGGERLCEQE